MMGGLRFFRFVFTLIVLISMSYSELVYSKIRYVSVDSLYLEIEAASGTNREDFRAKDREIDGYTTLGYSISIGKYLYTRSEIRGIMSSAQFRKVGLEFEMGVEPVKGVELFVGHISEHTMDFKGYKEFPQKNTVGVRFVYIGD